MKNDCKRFLNGDKRFHRIPSSDTILRVLARIETKVLENVFAEYARSTFKSKLEEDGVIAIKGKTERNSEYSPQTWGGKRHKPIHIVSALATRLGVCFGQVKKTSEKSNEITAIPEPLELLDLKDRIGMVRSRRYNKKTKEDSYNWQQTKFMYQIPELP